MTHDPLCPFAEWPDEHCFQRDAGVSICALIARVRADEREKAVSRSIIWSEATGEPPTPH